MRSRCGLSRLAVVAILVIATVVSGFAGSPSPSPPVREGGPTAGPVATGEPQGGPARAARRGETAGGGGRAPTGTTRTRIRHTNDFQLMSTNGRPHHAHSWQDTVNIPPRGQVVIRIHFTDYTGKTVLHCHILNHEDAGMMAVLEIVK
ncbi:multicopper oxidase domain-containing protein [Streptosporangium sp. NPDC006013]|uniref:multicopper oxidase domain-containing protein n=1 Tax=Streptosporangium sp. NPDC006013 TaxID=3155596 RepID=UPI0033ABEF1A